MASYKPQFIAPQGRGRPPRETDFPLEVKDFGDGTKTDYNPTTAVGTTKRAMNSRSKRSGILERRPGYVGFGTDAGTGKVYALPTLDKLADADLLFRIINGTVGVELQIYDTTTSDFVEFDGVDLGEGNAADRRDWSWTNVVIGGTEYLYLTNGYSNLMYTDGDTGTPTITEITGVKGRYITTLENIMFLGNLTITHKVNQVVYTKAGTNQFYADEDGSYANSTQLITVDGEVTQLASFGGLVYIFTKDSGVWEVDPNTFIPRKISTEGTNAPKSVAVGNNLMVWVNKDDIYMKPLGGEVQKISDDIRSLLAGSLNILK